jgi:hypothetical protein
MAIPTGHSQGILVFPVVRLYQANARRLDSSNRTNGAIRTAETMASDQSPATKHGP